MIKIICVGKLKERYLVDACKEYQKRITKYSPVEIIELKDSNIEKEKDEIIKHLDIKSFVITLQLDGIMLNSLEFAKKIDNIFLNDSNITFIIGGSDGLSEVIKNMSNFKISFSKLTFPHQLFRVILLEQIYRSFKILNNETYHK